jgi:hypothetical protein
MASDGQGLAQIAARLYTDKHPTPTEHKQLARQVLTKDSTCLWNKSYILEVLSNEQYIGTYVAGKTKILEIGSGKAVNVDESEWIRTPDHHPAIIGKAVYDAAREKINKKGEPLRNRKIGTWNRYKDVTSPLKGKVFCGCCNHSMKLSSTKNAAFHCDFTCAAPDAECFRLKILGSELETAVMDSAREQVRAILKNADLPSCSEHQSGYGEQIKRIEGDKCSLYERYVVGEISTDEYKSCKTQLDAEFEMAKQSQALFLKDTATNTMNESLRQIAGDALKYRKLSNELADALIEKVHVYPGSRIEVVLKMIDSSAAVINSG